MGAQKHRGRAAYPDTWYHAGMNHAACRPRLENPVDTDVCVVGAGLAGLTTALELLRRGRSVVLLEAKRIAWGASGRNGGFVIPGFAGDLQKVISRVGLPQAKILYSLSVLGTDYVKQQILELDPGLKMGSGFLLVSRYNADTKFREYAQMMKKNFSREVSVMSKQQIYERLRTDQYRCGVYDSNAFHIHPLNYALALAVEIERLGGRIFEHTPGTKLTQQPNGCVVGTPDAQVRSEHVVLCTSAYDHKLFPAVSRAVLPVATHIAVTEALPENRAAVINTEAAISDTRLAGDYYRMADRRVLWGGKITTQRTPPRGLHQVMQRTMASVYPELGSIDIEYSWSGLMGYSIYKMPIIGEIRPRVWAATAFGGLGLNTTAMAGCLIASAIAQGDDRWRHFSSFGPAWAGGAIGRMAVQFSYWAMRARDLWYESIRG